MEQTRGLSRRSFLKLGGFAAAGAAGATALAGCAPQAKGTGATEENSASAANTAKTPSFLIPPDPITSFEETKEYDVVVVGVGAAGSAALVSAVEAGAKVAFLQKEEAASSQGFSATGVDLEYTTTAAKAGVVSYVVNKCDERPKRELVQAYADNSGEAIKWYRDIYVRESGTTFTPSEETVAMFPGTFTQFPSNIQIASSDFDINCNGYIAHFVNFSPENGLDAATKVMAEYAEKQGADAYYSTPAVQLYKENGRITGVIGETGKDKYTLFKASKGVILASGDYQCDEEMIAYYCPDCIGFPNLQINRTGDGQKMGLWVGGAMEPVGHTKMIHDTWQLSNPYLIVNPDGNRFMNENTDWWKLSTNMRELARKVDNPDDLMIYSIVDANYLEQAKTWKAEDAGMSVRELPEGFYTQGDTIESLAQATGLPADALKKTVERYNELCELGSDEDFGKPAEFLMPISTPPFYAVKRDFNYGLSAICGGLVINKDNQVLDEQGDVIEGLYAVGNVSGPFYGSPDYPFVVPGMSIGRAITGGYVAGKFVAMQ